MSRFFQGLVWEEAGATSIEYALIGTLVGVACVVAFLNFSDTMGGLYAVIESITVYL